MADITTKDWLAPTTHWQTHARIWRISKNHCQNQCWEGKETLIIQIKDNIEIIIISNEPKVPWTYNFAMLNNPRPLLSVCLRRSCQVTKSQDHWDVPEVRSKYIYRMDEQLFAISKFPHATRACLACVSDHKLCELHCKMISITPRRRWV